MLDELLLKLPNALNSFITELCVRYKGEVVDVLQAIPSCAILPMNPFLSVLLYVFLFSPSNLSVHVSHWQVDFSTHSFGYNFAVLMAVRSSSR